MSRRRRPPARWPLVVIALLFVGVGGAALLSGGEDGDEKATDVPTEVPTEEVAGDPDPIVVSREPYALTYQVEGYANDGGVVVDLERRWVKPPYAGRVETVPSDDPEATPTFVQISDLGLLQTGREGETRARIATEPTVAPGDARVTVDALEWRHETRTILDRRCQVFRAGAPIDVATPDEPEEGTWADLCVADDGLVLQEEWVIGGDVFRRRTAIELDESPTFDEDAFEVTGERGEGSETGVLTEVTADSRPPGVTYYELLAAPEGFHHVGRFAYAVPRPPESPGTPRPAAVATVLDLYEDSDGGLLVVANGGTSDRSTYVQPDDDSELVDLGPIGSAELVRGLRQHELRVGFERGRFLRVYGTVPADTLTAIARSLHANTDPNGTVTAKR